jgi:ABC-type bacteriocin/lantibiotic exporter with double-glycine peptidase domain
MKLLILAVLIVCIHSYNFPLYKQCNSSWANQQLGTSSQTICQAGCLISSASMGLSGVGRDYNPGTINTWLKAHNGYVSGNLFVWASINSIGLFFEGKVANSQIKTSLDQKKIVICNVNNGGHWVLATGYSGNNILVNDPGYAKTQYSLTEIVDGQNGVYHPTNGEEGEEELPSMFMTLQKTLLRK